MKTTAFKNFSVSYREDTADEAVLSHSFDRDIFFSSIPYYTPPVNAVVIDVGAHIGTFSLLMSHLAPKGICFALEPSNETFEVLQSNSVDNKLRDKLIPCKYALYDTNSTIRLYHDEQSGNWGHSVVKQLSNSFEDVETITLDRFFELYNISYCDLIKFNCEGAEFNILADVSDKVLNRIDTWIILFHEDLAADGNRDKMVRRLKKNGFIVNVIRVSEDNKRGWITATKSYRQYIKFSLKSKWKNLFRK
jgi:FkbM family methyltransferase